MRDNFCIFILTNRRPDRVYTFSTLRSHGYTGRIFLVVDDEDPTIEAYRERYGDAVLVFSKSEIAETFDQGDNFTDRRTVFYARNACWALAERVGVRFFMHCDDDYTGFYIRQNAAGEYGSFRPVLDPALEAMIRYFETIPALSIAMSQGGDHIAGIAAKPQPRKAMNTFLCDVRRPFAFVGRINEDVNTYVGLGRTGALFLTIPTIQVNQKTTQSNPGGMTEMYLESGTYVKSFYSIMYAPSAVKIGEMGQTTRRIHHSVNWPHATAQIIRAEYRKPDERGTPPVSKTRKKRQEAA